MAVTQKQQSDSSQQQQFLHRNSGSNSLAVEAYHGGLNQQELQRHGIALEQAVDFSSNILPHGPSSAVKLAVCQSNLAAYPDRDCVGLRKALATRLGVDAAKILVGNGSSELIHLIARTLIQPNDSVLIIGPTFSEYERASNLAAAQIVRYCADEQDQFVVDREKIDRLLSLKPIQLVWLCNPNNPTGQIVDREIVLHWIRANPRTLFVVDESYIEFSSQPEILSLCAFDEPNLIVVRSMTKSFGMAGLRLGYAVLSHSHHRLLCNQRIPWSVSSVAQAAGAAALQDDAYYHSATQETLAAKVQLVAQLKSIGLPSIASDTNYFLLPLPEAQRTRELLLAEGLIIRDCTSFGLPNYARIAALDPLSNRRLVLALARSIGTPVLDDAEQVSQNQDFRQSVAAQATILSGTDESQTSVWNAQFRSDLELLFRLRRDVRRFKTDNLPAGALQRWITAACLAPSVGLSQPWKFVSVTDTSRRAKVVQEFESQNLLAAEAYDESMSTSYRQLKLAGLNEAPEHLAVFVDPNPEQGHGLGRQTMPESVAYSVVAAIQNLWLAARSEGVGVGWVSILRPEALNGLLDVPSQWRLIAYLCMGYPLEPHAETPELESLGWESRSSLEQQWHQR